MRDVAVIATAQSELVAAELHRNEVEMLMPVTAEALARAGLTMDEIGFTCSGSSDYLAGQAFSFVMTLDGVGPWPPISESHVEMDGAWALYEAWVKLQTGEVDTALVYSYGKSSPGSIRDVLCLQLDPYYVAPLWPDSISLAALQARALLDSGKATERDFASVAARAGKGEVAALLEEPYVVEPLRRHDCPPVTDGVVAVVLAAGGTARRMSARPAWIRGIDHRIEPHSLGARDLTSSVSTALAAKKAGVASAKVDLAEVHAPFSAQELIIREALGLGSEVEVNPSGGALKANPVMAAGLIRIAEAAERILTGRADRAVAHATSGPCLQQNLVCVLEGD